MLSSLHIENIAVIRELDLEFCPGFTVISGETGAGKSIILESIRLLLGARGEKDLIRNGESKSTVIGVFSGLSAFREKLSSIGIEPDEDDCLMIHRTLSDDGRSAVRVNGRTGTLAQLREIGAVLLNIHGQNSTSVLQYPDSHLTILDSYAGTESLLNAYRPIYDKWMAIKREIADTVAAKTEKERMTDILRYQISEIEEVSPKENEEEKLLERRALFRNREKVTKQANFIYKALFGAEKGNVHYLISKSITALESLSECLPNTEELVSQLTDVLSTVDDVAETVYDAAEPDSDIDPTEMLDKIEGRLESYAKLHRKYGADTKEVLRFYAECKEKLEGYENADSRLTDLKKAERALLPDLENAAEALRNTRVSASKQLIAAVKETLFFLDMPKADFCIDIADTIGELYTVNGKDAVTFLISANPGEAPKSVADATSGGELSRIMLAIESVIAEKENIPTVIYDEVDTGVSGKTARKIGLRLCENAKRYQVLSITHSAQIASLADEHYRIEKHIVGERTESFAHILSEEERVEELARILGGLNVTDVQRKAARDLLAGNDCID